VTVEKGTHLRPRGLQGGSDQSCAGKRAAEAQRRGGHLGSWSNCQSRKCRPTRCEGVPGIPRSTDAKEEEEGRGSRRERWIAREALQKEFSASPDHITVPRTQVRRATRILLVPLKKSAGEIRRRCHPQERRGGEKEGTERTLRKGAQKSVGAFSRILVLLLRSGGPGERCGGLNIGAPLVGIIEGNHKGWSHQNRGDGGQREKRNMEKRKGEGDKKENKAPNYVFKRET